jgi:hypothetical protein
MKLNRRWAPKETEQKVGSKAGLKFFFAEEKVHFAFISGFELRTISL